MAGRMQTMPLARGGVLDFSNAPLVMGILNCTPDSFYSPSSHPDPDEALSAALRMVDEGAAILDVGGESTRPGAAPVDADEETRRVLPTIRAIRANSEIPISIDTRKSSVAAAALDAGADMVNDVSGLRFDPRLASLVAERQIPVVIMHMRGTPGTMQLNPEYDDTISEIRAELSAMVDAAIDAGVDPVRIVVDPGIGFGKRPLDNLRIIREIASFREMGYPVLVGASRKSFIEAVRGRVAEDRLAATLAVNAWATLHGAAMLRVHDVAATVDLVRMLRAVETGA